MKQILISLLLLGAVPGAWAAGQDGRQIEQVANQFLHGEQGKDGYTYKLKLSPRKPLMPACDQPLQADWPAGGSKPQHMLLVSCNSQGWSLSLQVEAAEVQLVLVTTRLVRAGDVLQPGDVRLAAVNNRSLLSQGLRDESAVVGQMLRTALPPGAMLTASQLRSPYVVKMNQPVKLQVLGDGFSVSSDAVALGNASVGERVSVRVSSGKVISALVEADGSVSLQLQ
ncbi:flagellar basal body P-ring formation chaperone FlgA [Vogesella sp. LIG4]|uniref:flagellar basal body P-ring formation chaperone FlgA n=1 Tax=Vogesella sp. LIG4 TaxID=1192162 RepID=UPI00081F87BF|nr:flagellar basal body P-ring formation chaperone FlgA [Vogesella sp. LIG4]SCK07157.1 flagella basal body P-ring formation protein FlgA [Vogesella sp. LIG4]